MVSQRACVNWYLTQARCERQIYFSKTKTYARRVYNQTLQNTPNKLKTKAYKRIISHNRVSVNTIVIYKKMTNKEFSATNPSV